MPMIVRKVGRIFYKGRFNNKKNRWQGNKDKEEGLCYNYKKPGHLIVDCPKMKNKTSTSKKTFKKRAMKAMWDDSESGSEEVDTANMCFMAHGNHASKYNLNLF